MANYTTLQNIRCPRFTDPPHHRMPPPLSYRVKTPSIFQSYPPPPPPPKFHLGRFSLPMVVRIRLARWGHRNKPFYRIVAADSRSPRDGRHLDILGAYNPLNHSKAEAQHHIKRVWLNVDRIKYWLSHGAQPSETGIVLAIFLRVTTLFHHIINQVYSIPSVLNPEP